MVVNILVVRHQRLVDDLRLTHQSVNDLAHRQHEASQQDQIASQVERLSLHLAHPVAAVVEQIVLERLDALVEILHRLELPVDDVVEETVEQEAGALLDQVGCCIPALHDLIHVELAILAHGD